MVIDHLHFCVLCLLLIIFLIFFANNFYPFGVFKFEYSFVFKVYFERTRVQAVEGQREGETQPQAGPASCQHGARHGARTHEPRDRDMSRNQESDT